MAIAIVDTGATQTGTSTTSITLSATLSASADLLIVCVTHRSTSVANNYPTGITYNSVSMTMATSSYAEKDSFGLYYVGSSIWYLKNPSTGSAYNIVATWGSSIDAGGYGWATFSGSDSTTPVGTANTLSSAGTTSPSITVTDYTSGDITIGVTIDGGGSTLAYTAGTNCTKLADYGNAGANYQSSYEYNTTDAVISWSKDISSFLAASAVALKPTSSSGSWLSRNFWWDNI